MAIDAGQFLVLGQIGSLVPSPCNRCFQIPIQMDSGLMSRERALTARTPPSVDPRWIRSTPRSISYCISWSRFWDVPMLLLRCSSAGFIVLEGWIEAFGGLLCYAHGHFDCLLFNYILVYMVRSPEVKLYCCIGLVIVGSDTSWLWSVFGYSSLLELISSFAFALII